jgi:acyl dehydratase
MRGEVLETTPSRSKLDRGMLRYRMTIFNQNGEDVMSMLGMQILRRQAPD